jgi:hypothetical protein
MTKTKKSAVAVVGLALAGAVASTTMLPASSSTQTRQAPPEVSGKLLPLNSSGAFGSASADFFAPRKARVHLHARRLAPGLPHAQHIHFGQQARNECPVAADAGPDHQLTTSDGAPAYGPVVTSLTTRGDTSPESVLAVDRYPAAQRLDYARRITFDSGAVARAVRGGRGVVVIHGVDYNGNGEYDFESGASDLDASLPAEATDPAVCAVLR